MGGACSGCSFPIPPYQVLHFWDTGGTFQAWYVNFEATTRRQGDRVDTVGWHLDLVLAPDGTGHWKDEAEADVAVAGGRPARGRLLEARALGDSILRDFSASVQGIGDWRGHWPPDQWAVFALPTDWAQ